MGVDEKARAGKVRLIITVTTALIKSILFIQFILFDLLSHLCSFRSSTVCEVNVGAGASKDHQPIE
jgi:hypothetical protein